MEWYEQDDMITSTSHGGRSGGNTNQIVLAQVVRWFPVALLVSLVIWSYYVFLIRLILLDSMDLSDKIAYLVPYHIILLFFATSFIKTIFTPPGSAPELWKLSDQMKHALETAETEDDWVALLDTFVMRMGIRVKQRSVQGAIRYCEKCFVIKPDRAHHCSVCNACILKVRSLLKSINILQKL
jgi:hypothetical protein